MIHAIEYEAGLRHALERATRRLTETRRRMLEDPERVAGAVGAEERALEAILRVAETDLGPTAVLTEFMPAVRQAVERHRRRGDDRTTAERRALYREMHALTRGARDLANLVRLQVIRRSLAFPLAPVRFRRFGLTRMVIFTTLPAEGEGRYERVTAGRLVDGRLLADSVAFESWVSESEPLGGWEAARDRERLRTALADAGIAPEDYIERARSSDATKTAFQQTCARWRRELTDAGFLTANTARVR